MTTAARTPLRNRDPHRPLDRYFHDLGSTRRLSASEELELATNLRLARVTLWTCLLETDESTRRAMIPEMLRSLGDQAPPALKRPPARWPQTLADELATLDRDGELARTLATEIAHEQPQTTAAMIRRAAMTVQRIRDRFVASNLGLVVSVARRYERRMMSLSDLIQEGNTGLLKAVDRFDPLRGNRFSTYAVWWIRHAIGRALSDRGREIRLPVHVAERQQTLVRARTQLETELGRPPTPEQMAERTGFELARVKDLLAVEYTRAVAHDPRTKTATAILVDELPAPANDWDADLDSTFLHTQLRSAMQGLPTMQQEILRCRYGLDGNEPMTLREVGRLHDLSRERIRQLQVRALASVRETFASRGLAS